jgi:hypothetical protein
MSGTESDNEPQRSRPKAEGYGIPDSNEEILTWDFVARAMSDDRFYWITTVRPDGKPHARPTWGVWVERTFYCGGGEGTRWVRNLSTNRDIVVHRGGRVIEGTAERIDEETAETELIGQVDTAYEKDSKSGVERRSLPSDRTSCSHGVTTPPMRSAGSLRMVDGEYCGYQTAIS